MTDQELKDLVAGLAVAQAETDRQLRATERQLGELGRQTDRQLRELGQQIGGLGRKFGGFTEGLAWPSMTRVLDELGATTVVGPRIKAKRNGTTHEFDGLGWTNTEKNAVWVVEIKSRLREEEVEQFLDKLHSIPQVFPEHRGKRVYGILTVVDAPENLRKKVLAAGVYLARIDDEVFELTVPEGFEPHAFGT